MSRVVFLVEELSMKVLLDGLLPRFFPGLSFQCVPHEGKQDLDARIPGTLRAWREPGVRFVIVRDNDGADCLALKEKLVSRCSVGRRSDTLVRIACQELEAWYIGDPEALVAAFEREDLRSLGRRARFRDPDAVAQPSRALQTVVPEFQKVAGARRMAAHLRREGNVSRSFQVFIAGVERAVAAIGGAVPSGGQT